MHQKLETMVGFQYEYGSELLLKQDFFYKNTHIEVEIRASQTLALAKVRLHKTWNTFT